MRTIHLYGSMGEQFGREIKLAVRSLTEAVLALGLQIPGFRKAIEEGHFRVTCGRSPKKGLKLDHDTMTFGLPAGDLHVVPVVKGRGRGGGVGKIIVGVLLAAASFAPGFGILLGIGASLTLAGVSSLLSPKKKAEQKRQSYMFDGADNTVEQGKSVPVIIGRTMVSCIPISAGVSTSDSNGLV